MKLTPMGKVTVLVVVAGAAFGVYRSWDKIAPGAAAKNSVTPNKIELPNNAATAGALAQTDFQVAGKQSRLHD